MEAEISREIQPFAIPKDASLAVETFNEVSETAVHSRKPLTSRNMFDALVANVSAVISESKTDADFDRARSKIENAFPFVASLVLKDSVQKQAVNELIEHTETNFQRALSTHMTTVLEGRNLLDIGQNPRLFANIDGWSEEYVDTYMNYLVEFSVVSNIPELAARYTDSVAFLDQLKSYGLITSREQYTTLHKLIYDSGKVAADRIRNDLKLKTEQEQTIDTQFSTDDHESEIDENLAFNNAIWSRLNYLRKSSNHFNGGASRTAGSTLVDVTTLATIMARSAPLVTDSRIGADRFWLRRTGRDKTSREIGISHWNPEAARPRDNRLGTEAAAFFEVGKPRSPEKFSDIPPEQTLAAYTHALLKQKVHELEDRITKAGSSLTETQREQIELEKTHRVTTFIDEKWAKYDVYDLDLIMRAETEDRDTLIQKMVTESLSRPGSFHEIRMRDDQYFSLQSIAYSNDRMKSLLYAEFYKFNPHRIINFYVQKTPDLSDLHNTPFSNVADAEINATVVHQSKELFLKAKHVLYDGAQLQPYFLSIGSEAVNRFDTYKDIVSLPSVIIHRDSKDELPRSVVGPKLEATKTVELAKHIDKVSVLGIPGKQEIVFSPTVILAMTLMAANGVEGGHLLFDAKKAKGWQSNDPRQGNIHPASITAYPFIPGIRMSQESAYEWFSETSTEILSTQEARGAAAACAAPFGEAESIIKWLADKLEASTSDQLIDAKTMISAIPIVRPSKEVSHYLENFVPTAFSTARSDVYTNYSGDTEIRGGIIGVTALPARRDEHNRVESSQLITVKVEVGDLRRYINKQAIDIAHAIPLKDQPNKDGAVKINEGLVGILFNNVADIQHELTIGTITYYEYRNKLESELLSFQKKYQQLHGQKEFFPLLFGDADIFQKYWNVAIMEGGADSLLNSRKLSTELYNVERKIQEVGGTILRPNPFTE